MLPDTDDAMLEERMSRLLRQIEPSMDAKASELLDLRDISANAFATYRPHRRRLPLGRWLVAAAAIIVIAAGTWVFDMYRPRESYAFADVPEKLRNARTLHWKQVVVDAYHMPQDRKFETITTEVWLDVDHGLRRSKYIGTALRDDGKPQNHGETFNDGRISTVIYHSDAKVMHWRVSPLHRVLQERAGRDDLLVRTGLADPAKLSAFFKSGRETIRGIECDVWDGKIPRPSRTSEMLVKVWIAADTGIPLRVVRKAADPQTMGFVSETVDVLETNVPLPPEFFRCPSPPPNDYTINAPPEDAPFTRFSTGGFSSSGRFKLKQIFTLPDGSLLLCWNNFTTTDQAPPPPETFTNLRFGGELPVMPVTIRSVRTNGAGNPEIEFASRHVAVTRDVEDDEVFLWSLFIPQRPPPPSDQFFGFTLVYGVHPEGPRAKWEQKDGQNDFSGGMAINNAADFDTFVRGVIKEMSGAEAPAEMTFDRLIQFGSGGG